jgi:outer membrane biosynthesis protein TonB
VGRKGKTRMPKRLVKKQAIIDMGYPFEEEDDFIIVKRALEKDHIDEIIKISENYKDEKTTYVYEEKTVIDAPPPPPSVHHAPPPPPPETFYPPPPPTVIHAPPPPPSIHQSYAPPPPPSMHHSHAPPPPPSHYSQSVRSVSPSRHEVYEERFEESNHIGGPLTVLVPGRSEHEHRVTRIERDVRSERDIKEEIRQLESERRMLKYEREGDYEVIERRERPREVVRIEKDRKGRLALVRSAH